MQKNIKNELQLFVSVELNEARNLKTSQEVLCARNRAFGAVLFAFTLDSELYKELLDWWNDDMLDKFNALINEKK